MCDNELFKKVEKGTDICISSTGGCLKCPYVPFYPGSCSYYRSVDTLALIRSQQARIKEFEAAQERIKELEAAKGWDPFLQPLKTVQSTIEIIDPRPTRLIG